MLHKLTTISFLALAFRPANPVYTDNPEQQAAAEALEDVCTRYSAHHSPPSAPPLILISVEMQAVLQKKSVAQLWAETETLKATEPLIDPLFDALAALVENKYGYTVSRAVPGCFFFDDIPLIAVNELHGNSCCAFVS